MAVNKQAIKARIRSINATKKITSAMELIANSKLIKQREQMEKNREYAEILRSTVAHIVSENPNLDNIYLKESKSNVKLTILFTSDLGLCGGYNTNMLKEVVANLNKKDPIVVVGNKLRITLIKRGYNVINEYINSDYVDYDVIKPVVDKAIAMYTKGEIGSIQVLFTEFVNTVSFQPKFVTVLPFPKVEQKVQYHKETIFEPNVNEILDNLIPMTIKNSIFSFWMQTKTAEQASRRLAMENATDNAEELNDKLVLAFNQARQSAITQEITEIVSGANAL